MKTITPVLLMLWLGLLLQACSAGGDSAQDRIREYIETGVEAAEERSPADLGDMIHGSYLDQKGHNKQQLIGLLRAYFFRHKNIHLFYKIDDIELLDEHHALVRLHVAMAGSVISDVDAISALRARIYSFELRLININLWFPAATGIGRPAQAQWPPLVQVGAVVNAYQSTTPITCSMPAGYPQA